MVSVISKENFLASLIGSSVAFSRLSLYRASLLLWFRFSHASASRVRNDTLFLVGRTHSNSFAVGEALPRSYLGGESIELVTRVLIEELNENQRAYLTVPLATLQSRRETLLDMRGGLGTVCALELCFIDGALREDGTDLTSINEALRTFPKTSITLPFCSLWWVSRFATWSKRWCPCDVKAKVTGDFEYDAAILKRLTTVLRQDQDVRIDLNGALRLDAASSYLERLATSFPRLKWIEEPLHVEDRKLLPVLSSRFKERFILCADESAVRQKDLNLLKPLGSSGAVNVRVGKHGGILESVRFAGEARASGLQLQVGSLVGETAVLTGAGALVASQIDDVRYLEVGHSPRLLKRSPVTSRVRNSGWRLEFQEKPGGLAGDVNLKWLKRHGELLWESSWK